MNLRKLYLALFALYTIFPAITGLGITYTASNHILLSTWYVLGFEIGIGLAVMTGFYSLYQYQLQMEKEEENETIQLRAAGQNAAA